MQQQQAESSTRFLSIFTFSLSLQSAEENYFRLCLSSSTDVCRLFHLLLIVFILRPSFEDVLSSGCVSAFFRLFWVDLRDCFYLFIWLCAGRESSLFLIPCVLAAQTYLNWRPFCSFIPKPASIFFIYKLLLYIRAGAKCWKPLISAAVVAAALISPYRTRIFFIPLFYLWLPVTGLKMKSDGEVDFKGQHR